MQKTFDIIIDDQQPVNPNNSFAIYRGDNVAFNFTFQRGGTALDVEGSTLRIFAKKLGKNGLNKLSNPLFAGDFVESNTATFDSSQTSGDAGNYVLSVLLLSSEQAVITSQCIYFELKENGYAGYYQPSEDFRDAIFEASQTVIDAEANTKQYSESAESSKQNAYDLEQSAKASERNAKASEDTARALSQYAEQYSRNAEQSAKDCAESVAIVQSAEGECLEAVANAEYYARKSQEASDKAIAITDPEGFRTSTAESIASLSADVVGKMNRGELYFNNGGFNCSQKWTTNGAFSVVFTMAINKEIMPASATDWIGTATNINSNRGMLISHDKTYLRFYLIWSDSTGTRKMISRAIVNDTYYDGKPHIWCYSFTGNSMKVKIDDTFDVEYPAADCTEIQHTSPFAFKTETQIASRIKAFNFDITSEDAPYTLADYVAGKDEPPNSALLSLSDYTFNGKVLDNSGNGNHATITGDVVGNHDNAVESFYQQVAVRIQNLIKG